ncbi:MAG TPA: hypothetical protein VEX68_31125 [Bryobacteraceae bacterium]|nr:hypothetical protein [Bryobacteraceae bacterium]
MTRLACCIFVVTFLLSYAFAQDQPGGLHTVACIKLQPGKQLEFREFAAHDIQKVMRAGADTGDFSAWYLLRSVFPVGAGARCDYLSVVVHKGTPPDPLVPERLEAAIRKSGIAMTTAEYLAKRSSLTTLVSSEMWRTAIQIAAPEKGDFLYVNSMKVHNMNEWMDMERRVWKPMAEAWVKDGTMRSWMVNRPVLPSGTDLKYQAITVDVYSSWDTALKSRSVSDTFKKIHPTRNQETTFEAINKSRDLALRELLYVQDKVVAAGAPTISQN